MSLPVYFADLTDVSAGSAVTLGGDEGRHAAAVRRTRVGEQISLTDGAGCRATGAVTEVGKRELVVTIERVVTQQHPEPRIVVVQAIPKGDRGELAVSMLTEVGVDVVTPWQAQRCVAVWRGDRVAKGVQKWRATARESAKQARRSWLPTVSDPMDTEAVAALVAEADLAVVLHEAAGVAMRDLVVPQTGTIAIVVGPEGGITDAELATLTAAGAHPLRLGAPVLRTSTAGVVGAAALLSRTPRW